jgi:hypothetical protein
VLRRTTKHGNEFRVFKQVTLGVTQALKQQLIQAVQRLQR